MNFEQLTKCMESALADKVFSLKDGHSHYLSQWVSSFEKPRIQKGYFSAVDLKYVTESTDFLAIYPLIDMIPDFAVADGIMFRRALKNMIADNEKAMRERSGMRFGIAKDKPYAELLENIFLNLAIIGVERQVDYQCEVERACNRVYIHSPNKGEWKNIRSRLLDHCLSSEETPVFEYHFKF